MCDSGEETICIWREINSFDSFLQIENSANEGWILMTEAIVFLTCPGTGFDVIE